MIDTLKKKFREEQFRPSWVSVFFNSNYLIRKGIYKGIKENAHFMTGTMLDLGCGMKPYRDLFAVDEYIGIDIKNEGHKNDTSTVDVFYDGKNIPFADSLFDSAYSSEVLTHISDIEPVIAEINRVIKPGGKFLVTVPYVWHENEQPNDAVRYTSFGITKLLERHNFKILIQQKQGNYFITALQTRNAYLYHALFPQSNILKLILTVIFIAPANLFGALFSPILGKNQDLFSNMVVVAQKI
jgi:SAM-dependent methyltransferase